MALPDCVGPRIREIWLWNAMFALILVCTNLASSPVSAQSSDGNMRPQQTRVSKSAPVLDEAENAAAAVSPVAGDLSAALVPQSPGPTEPKDWKSDQSCQALENAAAAHDLPLDFFVRLIRQESNFDPNSVSRAGAQGIAQFMPGTARWRGLADPFEPLQALDHSARWLRELRDQFGNLGLAAAAYNAGPRRVQDWLAGHGNLPGETRAYVRIITGRPVDEWVRGTGEDRVDPQNRSSCDHLVRRAPVQPGITVTVQNRSLGGPWGLQLIGNWSESKALSDYKSLQKRFQAVLGDRAPLVIKSRMAGRGSAPLYLIRVAESTRDRANQLCSRLEAAGGSCLVFRN